MSLAPNFRIRYGNSDELDNYDPTIDVYTNQEYIGGTQYNIFAKPQYDEVTKRTILVDENGVYNANRLIVSNRCVVGDGNSSIDIQDTLIGTITAKGYIASGMNAFSYEDITLISGVLNLQNNHYYKSIERYLNGVLYDVLPMEDCPSGISVTNIVSTRGHVLTLIPNLTASDNRTTREDIPWDAAFGDRYGYSNTLGFTLLPTLTEISRTTDSPTQKIIRIDYLDENDTEIQYRGGFQTDGNGNLITDPQGYAQQIVTISGIDVFNSYKDFSDPNVSPLEGSQEFSFQDRYNASDIIIDVDILAGGLSLIEFRDQTIMRLFIDKVNEFYGGTVLNNNGTSSYLSTVAELWNALNGGTDQGGACPNGIDDDYPNTTLGINTGNGFTSDATSTELRTLLESVFSLGATAQNFLESLRTDGVDTSTDNKAGWALIRFYSTSLTTSIGNNVFELTTSTALATRSLSSVGGDTFFSNYERSFVEYSDIVVRSQTSGVQWRRYNQFTIDGVSIIPIHQTDRNVDANLSDLTYQGKRQFNAYRKNWHALYLASGATMSGNISGSTIEESLGTATLDISGDVITATSAGSMAGLKLSNGSWYTFSEGYGLIGTITTQALGAVVADVVNGNHLTVSGGTWETTFGFSDYGVDWPIVYGGKVVNDGVYRTIFIPYKPNTIIQAYPTPSGFFTTNLYNPTVSVPDGSQWLLASGQVSQYRSELDSHTVGVTPFTESYGHYALDQGSSFTRWVIYPNNLSDPANTLLDFNDEELDAIGITYQVADITTLSNVNSSYSKPIKLPATARNNALLDYPFDPNNASFESIKQKKDCELSLNGVEILRGKASVTKSVKRDIPTSYELLAQGDNYNIFTMLDDLQCSGLDLGTFTNTRANIVASWGYDAASGNAVFAPINNGTIAYGTVFAEDMTPSFFTRNLLVKGFQEVGIAYESAFLDSDLMYRHVIPFSGSWNLSESARESYLNSNGFEATKTGSITASENGTVRVIDGYNSVTGSGTFNTASGIYTNSGGFSANFTVDLDVKTVVSGGFDPKLWRGFTLALIINDEIIGTRGVPGKDTFRTNAIDFGFHFINNGDEVKIGYYQMDGESTITNVKFRLNQVGDKLKEGLDLNLSDFFQKDLSVYDVLRGLSHEFCLQFYYDTRSKTLFFEPFGEFYTRDLDWRLKWDNSKDAEYTYLGDSLEQTLYYKYKGDSADSLLNSYKKENEGIEYGSYEYELPRNYRKGTRTIANDVFAPTFDRIESGMMLPTMWVGDGTTQTDGSHISYDFEYRSLIYTGIQSGANIRIGSNLGGKVDIQQYTGYPRLAFANTLNSGEDWQSLSFDTFNDGVQDRIGLFEQYYTPKINTVRDGITAIYELNINENDIANNPFNKRIYLDDAWWVINKIIDFNPLKSQSTKVELMRYYNARFPISPSDTRRRRIFTAQSGNINDFNNANVSIKVPFGLVGVPSGTNATDNGVGSEGINVGRDNQAPKRSDTIMMGTGLLSYQGEQTIFGQWNEPNNDSVFIIGGGNGDDARYNILDLQHTNSGLEFYLGDALIMTESNVNNYVTASGGTSSDFETATFTLTASGIAAGYENQIIVDMAGHPSGYLEVDRVFIKVVSGTVASTTASASLVINAVNVVTSAELIDAIVSGVAKNLTTTSHTVVQGEDLLLNVMPASFSGDEDLELKVFYRIL